MTFASVHVSDIGRRSLFISLGWFTLRIGVTMEDFRSDRMYLSLRDWLKMCRMTLGANFVCKVLKQFIWDVVGSYSFRSIK